MCLHTFTSHSSQSASLRIRDREIFFLLGFTDPAAIAQLFQRAEEALLGCLVCCGCLLGIRVHREAQQVFAVVLCTELLEQGEHFPLGHTRHLQLQTEKEDSGSNEGRDTEKSQEDQGAQGKSHGFLGGTVGLAGSRLSNIVFSFKSACLSLFEIPPSNPPRV